MRRFIWFLIILVVSVWLGLQIANDPGLAFFSYRKWSVEMPLWLAIIFLLSIMWVLYFLMLLVNGINNLFFRWKNWRRRHRQYKSYSKTNRGLIEIIEGHFQNAEHYLKGGLSESRTTLINYLALAKAAHEQGAYDRRDAYLRKAHDFAPEAEIAIGITQAHLQLQQGQLEQALATLKHLRTISPNHAMVLKLLERVYVHLGDWTSVLELIPKLYKTKAINYEQRDMLEKKVYEELLKRDALSTKNWSTWQSVWWTIPRKYKKNPEIIYYYAKQGLHYPEASLDLEALIYKSLKKTWNKNLAALYGDLITNDSNKQLANAEKLLKYYPNQPVLLFTCAKLCARCKLWGKGRRYFEDSLHLNESAETYLAYGKLLEQLGDMKSAFQNYQQGYQSFLKRQALHEITVV